jgi:hypothetical protein
MNLDTLFGYLFCELHPWGEVYVDNTYLAQTPMEEAYPLLPGTHKLTLRNPQATEFETEVSIRKGDTLVFRYNFNRGRNPDNQDNL